MLDGGRTCGNSLPLSLSGMRTPARLWRSAWKMWRRICQEICLFPEKICGRDDRSVEILEETLPDETDLILAVGGGTIHDLSRYVAYERRIPFISVPTAATMDGFTSTDSVLFWKGEEKALPGGRSPVCVCGYQHFFPRLPIGLRLPGYLRCWADISVWRTGGFPIWLPESISVKKSAGWNTERSRMWLKRLDDIREKDEDACERLMYALLLTGLATQMTGSLRPAACAEHQMAWTLGSGSDQRFHRRYVRRKDRRGCFDTGRILFPLPERPLRTGGAV